MVAIQQKNVHNRLLKALSPEDFALVSPGLTIINHSVRETTIRANAEISDVFFPESCVMTVLSAAVITPIGIGLVGFEGVAGTQIVLGIGRSTHDLVVILAGQSLGIRASRFQAAIEASASLRALLLRYVHCFIVQIAQTAFGNAGHVIEARLAGLLLLCRDRVTGDEIPITHDLLATIMNVRRASVTDALHILEGEHLVKTQRGSITITNAAGLRAQAEHIYGPAESEYRRLFGT